MDLDDELLARLDTGLSRGDAVAGALIALTVSFGFEAFSFIGAPFSSWPLWYSNNARNNGSTLYCFASSTPRSNGILLWIKIIKNVSTRGFFKSQSMLNPLHFHNARHHFAMLPCALIFPIA